MSREHVRVAVDIAMAAMEHLEPDELDDAVTEIERRMIALAERRGVALPPTPIPVLFLRCQEQCPDQRQCNRKINHDGPHVADVIQQTWQEIPRR